MRDGKISGVFETVPLNYEGAVKAMLGHAMTDVDIQIPEAGAPVMQISDVSLRPGSKPFSLDLHANEVVAITGLVGSGKTDLAGVLFGLRQPITGRMCLLGKPYHPASQRQAIKDGVFLCPKDRASNAVVQDFDITQNITVPFLDSYI